MNMRVGDRILYGFILLCLAALSVLALLISFQVVRPMDIEYWAYSVNTSSLVRVLVGVIGLIMLVLLARILIAPASYRRAMRVPSSIQVHTGEGGSAYISLEALDGMVQKVIRKHGAVRDVKSRVEPYEENQIQADLRITVAADTPIPPLLETLEQEVKAYVLSISGITVAKVRILVDAQAAVSRGTVE